MDKQPNQQALDELAQTQPGALEAALEDMVNSGFGNLEAHLPRKEPAPPAGGTKAHTDWGWW